jgi:hypothetical protein
MRSRQLTDTVKELEYELAKHQAVVKDFPNAKIHYLTGFQSKDVNQNYTGFSFNKFPYGVWVVPYCEVKLDFDGKTEMVKVHSCPKANRLVYLGWNRKTADSIIKFSRIAINFKNNQFKDDMLNACRAEIMSFIKTHPKYQMDDKHLEPRLKRLLAFV